MTGTSQRGVLAAGHPLSAAAGAEAFSAGGNAVDAALAAMLAACACEPLLTGLGSGGYMLVAAPGQAPVLLDFFVAMPGRGLDPGAHGDLVPVDVSFGDAVQTFHIGPASVGVPGFPAGVAEASRRFGRLPLTALTAPAAALARDGVEVTAEQGYLVEILGELWRSTPECAALFAPTGAAVGIGGTLRQPELAAGLERLGAEGSSVFYRGEIAAAIVEWVRSRGGLLTLEDLHAYTVVARAPVEVAFRGRRVLTNPPPSAGGVLIASALRELETVAPPIGVDVLVAAMEHAQRLRTAEFLDGLDDPAFVRRFPGSEEGGGGGGRGGDRGRGGRLGSTTHVSALDADGMACSVTCSNGASSGVLVPGTGVHLNNMLGEQDLNPLGFHRFPPGRRLPSMMSPTVVLRDDGSPELVLGSAGSNRIRSAILQTILRVLDDGLTAQDAVAAPRLHYEDGAVYAEPGALGDPADRPGMRSGLDQGRYGVVRFRARNLFFGGVQAVERDDRGRFWGGGDVRRGGAAIVVE